jgi:hypothetical protein
MSGLPLSFESKMNDMVSVNTLMPSKMNDMVSDNMNTLLPSKSMATYIVWCVKILQKASASSCNGDNLNSRFSSIF